MLEQPETESQISIENKKGLSGAFGMCPLASSQGGLEFEVLKESIEGCAT